MLSGETGLLAQGTVVDHTGGVTQNQMNIGIPGERGCGEMVDTVE